MCYSSAGKFCVIILIIALVIIGFVFFTFGVVPTRTMVHDKVTAISPKAMASMKTLSLVAGIFALLVCTLAIVGIFLVVFLTESRCLFYWLALFVVLAIIIDIVLIIEVEKVKHKSRNTLLQPFPSYGTNYGVTNFFDELQKKYMCCGVDGPEDYTRLEKEVPESCCPLQSSSPYGEQTDDPDSGDLSHVTAVPPVRNEHQQAQVTVHPRPKRTVSGERVQEYNTFEVQSNINYELPSKEPDIYPPPGGGTGAGEKNFRKCPGCYGKFIDSVWLWLFSFYFLITAKMLLEIAVGVTPCWVLLVYKRAHSANDDISVDACDS